MPCIKITKHMSKKNWSAFIPKEKLGTKNDIEVIFEIPKSEIESNFLSVDKILDLIAKSIISNGVQLNRGEVAND